MQFAFGSFNKSVHKHAEAVMVDDITKPSRHGRAYVHRRGEVLRCSSNLVNSTSPACLHGPVNRGAEKRKLT